MKHRIEKPITKIVSAVLTSLLVFNLIPVGSFRTSAEENETLTCASYTLRFTDAEQAVHTVDMGGSFTLTEQDSETAQTISGAIVNGRIEAASFTDGAIYLLTITLGSGAGWIYDSASNVFLAVPEPVPALLINGNNAEIYLNKVTFADYSGTVADDQGNPVADASVVVSAIGGYTLSVPITAVTDENGAFSVSLPALAGTGIDLTVAKDGYFSGKVDRIPEEGSSWTTVVMPAVRPDAKAPSLTVPGGDDRLDYYGADGRGRKDVTRCRIYLAEGTPDQYEEVSGLKYLYACEGALGSFQDVQDKIDNPIELGGVSEYTYVAEVTPGVTYTYYAVDNKGNVSESYVVTYSNDNDAPWVFQAGLYTGETSYETAGIVEKAEGYYSPDTMYLRFAAGDNDAVDHADILVKDRLTGSFGLYRILAPEQGWFKVPITAEDFPEFTEIAVCVYDVTGNNTGILKLTGMNLKKDAVAVGGVGPVISAVVEGTGVDPVEGSAGSVFRIPPKYTFSFTDPLEQGITDLSVTVNNTVITADENGSLITSSPASGTTYVIQYPKDAEGNSALVEGINAIKVSCKNVLGVPTEKVFFFYYDTTPPVINGITVEPLAEGTTLGVSGGKVYATGAVKVTVSARDGNTNAGLTYVKLLNNGEEAETKAADEGEDVAFILPAEYETTKDYTFNISVIAGDEAGNATEETFLTNANSNTGTGAIYISANKTELEVNVPEGTVLGEKTWYSETQKVSVSAKDEFSGIAAITVKVNGDNVEGSPFTYMDGEYPAKADLLIPVYSSLAGNGGKCEITVIAENGAGGAAVLQKEMYFDTTAPSVEEFTFVPDEAVSMNARKHGTYLSGPFKVIVRTADDLSGVTGVYLALDGVLTYYYLADENGCVTFPVSPDLFSSEAATHTITAFAVDNIGNKDEQLPAVPNEDNSNIISGNIVFDSTAPAVTAVLDEETSAPRITGEEDNRKTWYSEDITWVIGLRDDESGLGRYSVKLNGTEITSDADGSEIVTDFTDSEAAVYSREIRVSTAQAAPKEDCSYELVVTAEDNTGNESEVCRQIVYIDGSAPIITDFIFATLGPDGTLYIYPYDAYAKEPILVKVKARDNGSGPNSGVEKILLYVNGDLFAEQAVNPETGEAVFTVPAEELPEEYAQTLLMSAMAVDASGLIGEEKRPTEGVTNILTDTITIDNLAPVIDIRLPEQGQFVLDDQIWYTDDFEFVITGQDLQSGIRQFELRINGTEITADAEGTPIPSDYDCGDAAVTQLSEFRFKSQDHTDNNDTIVIDANLRDSAGNVTTVKKTIRIDRKAPVITGFALKPVAEADTLNYLCFGSFANGKVEVTVYVSDEAPSAGAGIVTLYLHTGDPVYLTAEVVDGKAVFVVPESELVSGADEEYTFSAVPVDAVNNIGTEKSLNSQYIPEMSVNLLRIENIAPTVSVERDDTPGKTASGKQWLLSDVNWTVSISDMQSGIASVFVTMNGKKILEDVNGQTIGKDYGAGENPVSSLQFVLNSSQVTVVEENSVTLEVYAVDNAGNSSSVYKETIYKDATAPIINGFRFRQQGGTETGLLNPGTSVSEAGYVFSKDTVVRISAEDPNQGSGIMSISYYLKNSDGSETAYQTVTADANGDVFITIKAPFKGEIYAKAYDQLSNAGDYVGVKGIIVETPDSHNAEPHITLTKPQATGVQSNGTELYNANVELNLRIADHYSGIKAVEWSVTAPYDQARNQTGTLTVGENGSLNGDTGWNVAAADGKMVTELTKTIVVSNDSNDITVRIRMRDAAGNTSERQLTFGIDKTIPTVEFSFDNNTPDSDYGNIYNQSRTMTIVVTERNFVPGDFTFNVRNTDGSAPAIGRWTEEADPNDPNKTVHTATVNFFSDGNYSIGLVYGDRAGNRAGIAAVPSFIIDRTRPVINVSYDNNDVRNGNYYRAERTATVTVVERNFDVSRVQIEGTAQKTGIWTANGDQHSITLTFSKDGSYSFTVTASDRAGNSTETYTSETFIIDTTAPELTLEGFDRANGGEVAPIITCLDDNFDPAGVNINLTRISNKEVHVRYTTSEIADEGRTGMRWTYANIDPEQENDDLYTFRLTATDKAGNACETIIKSFSVNRYGSTYNLDAIEKLNGKYSAVTEDLVIYEYNVDEIDTDEVKVELLRNNEHRNLVRGKDYAVETVIEKGQEYNQYKYIIRKEVFAQDGEYSIQIVSQDKAGNVNQNTEKGAENRIAFCIDKIEPDIIVIEPTAGKSYAQPSITASVVIRDNYKLDKVHFILDGAELQPDVKDNTYTLVIPEADSRQTLVIYATDAAGNTAQVEIKDILVTSSMLVRFIHNTAALVTTIILLLLLLALAVFMLIHRRRSNA
ncbi:MAG: Ig-like domain repeat protein [Lachnospiraceae bacterium]|nr:Ig-like domain repeat protein [Lachnospiraceae bacterium]